MTKSQGVKQKYHSICYVQTSGLHKKINKECEYRMGEPQKPMRTNGAMDESSTNKVLLDEGEKNKYANETINLVYKIASDYTKYGNNFDDLASAGLVGLSLALNSYKKEGTAKFSTYAYECIKNEMLKSLNKDKKRRVEQEVSLDKQFQNSDGNLLDIIPIDDSEVQISNKCLEIVEELSIDLSPLERKILALRTGVGIFEIETAGYPLRQKEVARILDLNQWTISRKEKIIYAKLKEEAIRKKYR
jgi:RNA polymerase sporulation-specific sigma factor